MPHSTFPCKQCGADLEYAPGTTHLKCQHCGAENDIAAPIEQVREEDFQSALSQLAAKSEGEGEDKVVVECKSCRAKVEMTPNTTSQNCPFCGSNIVATGVSQRFIKPKAVLPFGIAREKARDMFNTWLGSLWFAPSNLKKYAAVESDAQYKSGSGLAGLYLPYWTYDAEATTPYTGQRGDDYWVTVPVTVMVNGKPTTQMRQERRTRWSSVSGTVENSFDDVLVPASTSLPAERLNSLGSWDLKDLVPYRDDYLAGFRAESYTIDLPSGFTAARPIMEEAIQGTIRSDIGGDHQRISSMSPRYRDIMFKHILLPIWVSAYRYNGKVYRFLINARTGAVSGERPYSGWKIAGVVIAGLIAIGIVILLASNK